jgi:hypothetical protein
VARSQGDIVPQGTAINVRMIEGISSDFAYTGQRFLGSVAEPVRVGNRIVLPEGTHVYVKVLAADSAGRLKGRSELTLALDHILLGNRSYPAASQMVSYRGHSEGKKTGKSAGIGAAVGGGLGALLGGGKGAAIGAGVGAGTGVAVGAADKGRAIQIVPDSVVQFVLSAPLRIR